MLDETDEFNRKNDEWIELRLVVNHKVSPFLVSSGFSVKLQARTLDRVDKMDTPLSPAIN